MKRARRIVVAGLGAMTPALIATDQVQARSVDGALEPTQSASTVTFDQEALKSTLLKLSPTEKLRIAGDRIRISMEALPSRRGASPGYIQSETYPVQRCTSTGPGCNVTKYYGCAKGPGNGPAIAPPKAPAKGPAIGPAIGPMKKY